jgi:hypothetical protein
MRKVSLNLNEETPLALRMRSVRKTDFFFPSTSNQGTIHKFEKDGFLKSSRGKSSEIVQENKRISSSLERINNTPQFNKNENRGFRPYGMRRESEKTKEEERKVTFI